MQREKQEAYGALEQEVDLKKRVYGQHYKEHSENTAMVEIRVVT